MLAPRRIPAVLVVALSMGSAVAGCIAEVDNYYLSFDADRVYVNPGVIPGNYEMTDANGSNILGRGFLPFGDPEIVRLRSDHAGRLVPVTVSETEERVLIAMAVWRPVDGTAEDVPVIVEAGPYFEVGYHCLDGRNPPCPDSDLVPNQIDWPLQPTTAFLIKNFLPLGYAVAQVGVRGSGTSGGCMELMGPREQADLNKAITWLADQSWSNGNVAMLGVSYDGSTPWMVAATGNPALKTIVPISGLPDQFDLMFRNGSAESRGAIMHSLVYWPYGFSTEFPHALVPFGPGVANSRQPNQDRHNLLCREAYEGAILGPYATLSGERGTQVSDYYRVRDWRDDVLANYQGSVFLVHGLQDWNVDPHAAVPFNEQLRDAGIPTKEWYGQWGHTSPDGSCPTGGGPPKEQPRWMWLPCRFDFAETLRHWFDYYLKGNTSALAEHHIQVQDNRGNWHILDSYPPRDASWLEFRLGADRRLDPNATVRGGNAVLLPPAQVQTVAPTGRPTHLIELETSTMAQDTRISGLPQLHVAFEALGQGGYLGAWLFDVNETGRVLDRWAFFPSPPFPPACRPGNLSWCLGTPAIVGHAQMDLRFHDGGETARTLQPGSPYVARMQFEPLDILVPQGHRLRLWLFQYQYGDHVPGTSPSPVKVLLGDKSVLRLPTIQVDTTQLFPVPGSHTPNPLYYDRMHVRPRPFTDLVPAIWQSQAHEAGCWRALRDEHAATGQGDLSLCLRG